MRRSPRPSVKGSKISIARSSGGTGSGFARRLAPCRPYPAAPLAPPSLTRASRPAGERAHGSWRAAAQRRPRWPEQVRSRAGPALVQQVGVQALTPAALVSGQCFPQPCSVAQLLDLRRRPSSGRVCTGSARRTSKPSATSSRHTQRQPVVASIAAAPPTVEGSPDQPRIAPLDHLTVPRIEHSRLKRMLVDVDRRTTSRTSSRRYRGRIVPAVRTEPL
jgi:hypothetical protein